MSILRGSLAVSLMGLSVMFETCLLETGFREAWSIFHMPQKMVLRTKNVCIVSFIWITEHWYGRSQAESIMNLIYKVNNALNSNTSKLMCVRAFLFFWNLYDWKTWKPHTRRPVKNHKTLFPDSFPFILTN